MKRLLYLPLAMLCLLLAAGCSDDAADSVFQVSCQETVAVAYRGQTLEVPVEASGKVTVYASASWISFKLDHHPDRSPQGTLVLTVEKNIAAESRETSVRLAMDGQPDFKLRISQEGAALSALSLEATPNALHDAVVFTLDEESGVWSGHYLFWRDGDHPERFIPTFVTEGKLLLKDGTEVVSGQTAVSLAEDLPFVVQMPSGDTYEYVLSLNCPQINGELPVLHMKPERLIADKENYVDTHLELTDRTPGSTGEGWWDSDVQGTVEVRGRGNSTWGLLKKPYRLKFPEKFSPIGLDHAKAKSWTLLAQDMDKSLLRTHLAFEYSRLLLDEAEGWHDEKAVLFTPCSRYVNVYLTGNYFYSDTYRTVYLDGAYLGVYQMSDQVERDGGRIAVEKLEADDGANPDKISGGYVLETDVHDGDHYSRLKGVKYSIKYPKDDDCDPAQYEYIASFVDRMEAALYSDHWQDSEEGWRKYLDERTLVDFIIIKELAADMDGFTSTYLYKRRGVDKLFFGPIWDCDKGWDNERRINSQCPPSSNLMIHAGFGLPGCDGQDWYERLWEDRGLRRLVAERWAARRDALLSLTDRVLDEVPASMQRSIQANFMVWDFDTQFSSEAKAPASSYEAEIERIRTLTRERAALLDRLFNAK